MKSSFKFIFAFVLILMVTIKVNAQHKVVIQLNTADTSAWSSTIGNIKNLQKIWPNKVQVEVVVHGKALDFLVAKKTHLTAEIEELVATGIQFSACENSMRKHNILKEDLLKVAVTVPSGVAEVVLKQEAGWSYLKAGVN